jgi:hypothetical protein
MAKNIIQLCVVLHTDPSDGGNALNKSESSNTAQAKASNINGEAYCHVLPADLGPEVERKFAAMKRAPDYASTKAATDAERMRWDAARQRRKERLRLQAIVDGRKAPVGIGDQSVFWILVGGLCMFLYFIISEPWRWGVIAFVLLLGRIDSGFIRQKAQMDAMRDLAKMPPPDQDELTVRPLTLLERIRRAVQIILAFALAVALIWLLVNVGVWIWGPGRSRENPIHLSTNEDCSRYPDGICFVGPDGYPFQKRR